MKKQLLCIALSFVLLFSAIILRIANNYSAAFDEFAETIVKANLKIDINRILTHNINSRNIQFNEITVVNYSSDGRILSISINSALLNTILLEFEEAILNELKSSSITIGMPLGNLFGLKMLSGKGPPISVDIQPIISTAQEPKSELLSSGINQSLHRITAVFETEVNCIAPFHKINCKITTTLILSEILIVGEIPEIIVSPVC